jgi:hypothetical protein
MLRITTSTCFKTFQPTLRAVSLRTFSTTAPKSKSDVPPREEKDGKEGATGEENRRKGGIMRRACRVQEMWFGNGMVTEEEGLRIEVQRMV